MENQIKNDWASYDGSYALRMKHGFDLYLRPGCEYSRARFMYRITEANELDYLETQSFEGAVCVDVGANIGYWSVFFSQRQGVSSVHCFEPDPITFEILKKNLAGANNATPNNAALHDHSGALDLYLAPDHSGDNRPYPIDGREHISVPAFSLDDYVANKKIRKVDFIKIDVQGGEQRVLDGSEMVVREYKPLLIVELTPAMNETNQPPLAGYLLDFSSKFDYSIYCVSNNRLVQIGSEEVNLFQGNLILKSKQFE